MSINSNGKVGIGTTSPDTKLHIAATGAPDIRIQDLDGTNQYGDRGHNGGQTTYVSRNNIAFGSHAFYSNNGTTTQLRVKFDETFGAGSSLVTASGNAGDSYGGFLGTSDVATVQMWASHGGLIYIGSRSNHDVNFTINNSVKMVLDTNGDFGIGNTNPGYKLDVTGTLGVSDLPFNSTSASVLVANETLGAEIITNGDFNTDLTDWTNNSTYPWTSATHTASGVRLQTSGSAQYKSFFQNIGTITSGKTYRIRFSAVKTSGTMRVGIETSPVGSSIGYNKPFTSSVVVDDVFTATVTDTTAVISFWAQNDSSTIDWVIDNVSIREVISASNQIQKREISADAFLPANGPYLPLSAGTGFPLTGSLVENAQLYVKGGANIPLAGGGTINAYTRTVSTNLFSALRVWENTAASNYWDIGATNAASTLLNFYHNAGTTPKISFTHTGGAIFTGNVGINDTLPNFSLDISGTLGVSDLPFNTDSVSVLVANETIGAELITNGDFATDADWTKGTGTTISGGAANFSSATAVSLFQDIGTQTGNVKVEFTVTSYTSGTLNVYSGSNQNIGVINVSANALGTYSATVDRTGGNVNIIFGSSVALGDFTGSIDNVSVKLITSASDQIQKRELGPDAFGPGTGTGPYLPLAGGTMTGDLKLNDDVVAKFGTGEDLRIQHAAGGGGVGFIQNYKGNLQIEQHADGKDILLRCDDGSGGLVSYLVLDGSTTHAYFSNPGNVGIGTSSPAARLDVDTETTGVNVDNTAAIFGNVVGTTQSRDTWLKIRASSQTNDRSWAIGANQSGDFRFNYLATRATAPTSGSTLVTIKNTGNVGIGTTAPLGKLQINEYTVAEQGSQTLHGELTVFANSGDESLVLGIKNAAYPNRGWAFNPVTNGVNSDLQIKEHGASDVRMVIQTGGNVGIGVTAPSTKLEIAGTVTINSPAGTSQSSYGLRLRKTNSSDAVQAGGEILASPYPINTNAANLIFKTADTINNLTQRMVIDGIGNVGIGNTSPSFKLHVDSDVASGDVCFIHHDNASQSSGTVMKIRSDAGDNAGSALLNIENNTGNALYVRGDRNVGIGTSTPSAKLDIQGTQGQLFSVTDNLSGEIFAVADISGVPIMSINSNGRTTFAGSIVLKDQPAASTASGSGTIVNWSVSAPLNVGQVYAVKTDGGWTNATQNTATARLMLGYSLGTNANQGMLLQGFFYKPAHGFAIGTPLYIGASQGTLTTVAPTGTGDFVRIIGYATSTDYIYFDPDKTWIELT